MLHGCFHMYVCILIFALILYYLFLFLYILTSAWGNTPRFLFFFFFINYSTKSHWVLCQYDSFFLLSTPGKNSWNPYPMHLALLAYHLVSCTHNISTFLVCIISSRFSPPTHSHFTQNPYSKPHTPTFSSLLLPPNTENIYLQPIWSKRQKSESKTKTRRQDMSDLFWEDGI